MDERRDPVERLVSHVRLRLFVRGWIGWTLRCLFIAAIASLIWVVLTRMFPQLGDPFWPVLGVLAASYPVGLLVAVLRRPSRVDAALAADREFNLRERVTTALELSEVSSPMADAVREDARRSVIGAKASRAVPLAIGSRARWVYVPLLALGLAYVFLPEMDLFQYRERTAEADARREAVAVHVERIREAIDPLEVAAGLDEASPMSEITAELGELQAQMEAGALTEKQAMAKLDNLAEKLDEQRRQLAEQGSLPALARGAEKFGLAGDIAKALQEGKLADLQTSLQDLQKKLQDETLTEQERKALSEGLKKLSESMSANSSAMSESLADALAKASSSLESGDLQAASESLQVAELTAAEIESILRQLDSMKVAKAYLAEWKGDLMGEDGYCRYCGSKLGESGECENGECEGHGHGLGLRGAGHGTGNRIGQVPEMEAGFQPTQAPGPTTQGKMLADLLQRSTPEAGEEATVEYLTGSFEQLEQEAEQALTQEEIPPGAKEFVRQYFGAIEPERSPQ